MNPQPFSSLNHFTLPTAIACLQLQLPLYELQLRYCLQATRTLRDVESVSQLGNCNLLPQGGSAPCDVSFALRLSLFPDRRAPRGGPSPADRQGQFAWPSSKLCGPRDG